MEAECKDDSRSAPLRTADSGFTDAKIKVRTLGEPRRKILCFTPPQTFFAFLLKTDSLNILLSSAPDAVHLGGQIMLP